MLCTPAPVSSTRPRTGCCGLARTSIRTRSCVQGLRRRFRSRTGGQACHQGNAAGAALASLLSGGLNDFEPCTKTRRNLRRTHRLSFDDRRLFFHLEESEPCATRAPASTENQPRTGPSAPLWRRCPFSRGGVRVYAVKAYNAVYSSSRRAEGVRREMGAGGEKSFQGGTGSP